MAVVFEAEHPLLGIRVAIKQALPSLNENASVLARFRNEAECLARLRHPHVVRLYDYGVDRGDPFLSMDLLEGEPLSAALAAGPLTPRQAADIFLPVLSAMVAVHAAGITHRDLKPHNLFLRRIAPGVTEPVVIDFGVARWTDRGEGEHAARVTQGGCIVGTVAYMAPEQILDAGAAGPAADQYALGVTLYECLTGSLPYAKSNTYELLQAAMHARPHAPSELREGLSGELDRIVLRAMAREPGDRFVSLHAFGEALLPFASPHAAMMWNAEAALARAIQASVLAPGATKADEPAVVARVPRARRSAKTWAWVAAVVVAALGTGVASLRHRDTAAASPGPAASLVSAAIDAPAPEGRGAAAAVAAPMPEVGVRPDPPATHARPHRVTVERSGPRRGTNGAPILE
jgi:serine/threonine-protein kinase